jgi:6-pyruvoyl-tetrahydropterin synthase
MVIDFNHIKPIIKKITDRWDHTMINDNPKLANPDGTKIHPTAENMARVLYAEFNAELGMAKLFKGPTMCLAWVEVEETPGAIIRYTPEHV